MTRLPVRIAGGAIGLLVALAFGFAPNETSTNSSDSTPNAAAVVVPHSASASQSPGVIASPTSPCPAIGSTHGRADGFALVPRPIT
jgi:hypothetical protein